jgi:fido (protein-threonine AMPylation protein)
VHAETVRIHPFIDGNGRTTRLLADLAFLAAQGDESVESYDWAVDKDRYIALLREYDRTRDPRPLATFIPVIPSRSEPESFGARPDPRLGLLTDLGHDRAG